MKEDMIAVNPDMAFWAQRMLFVLVPGWCGG